MAVIDNSLIQLPALNYWGTGEWRSRAACRNYPTPNDFFPDRRAGEAFGVARARMVCITCPVRLDCLQFALANCIVDGTYGGLPPKERRGLSEHTVTERNVQITIRKAAFYAKRANGGDHTEALAKVLGKPKAWVKDTLANDPNYLI